MTTADTAALFRDLVEFDPSRKRTNHLLKVVGYALAIGRLEGLDDDTLATLELAALLHDVGIKPSLEKYASSAGEYQHREGPPLAGAMLEKYAVPPTRVARVLYLIAHHHDYAAIDGPDYQILVEADFLVNCDEKDMSVDQVRHVRDAIFKTGAGTELLERLFDL